MQMQAVAQIKHDLIVLNNETDPRLISESFSVYKQGARVLPYEEFSSAFNFLAYSQFNKPNYGTAKNGVWLYARMINQSDIKNWTLSIRFSQLQDVRLYIRNPSGILYNSTDGILNKSSPYALPSFNFQLPKNETVEVFLYLRASSLNLVAPVYMQDTYSHSLLSHLDYSIWGVFYGVVILLALFTVTFLLYNRHVANVFYLAYLFSLLVFQLLWSGHAAHLPNWIALSFLYLRAESIMLVTVATANAFTLMHLPFKLQQKSYRKFLIVNTALGMFFTFLFLSNFLDGSYKLIIAYSICFSSIIVNLLQSIFAFRKGFFPGRPLIVGWTAILIGSLSSAFFIFGVLPNNMFHQQLFYLSLLILACTLLFSIVLKKQYDLKLEVKEAQTDAENNFYLIEEQNVHLDLARKEAEKASDVKSQFLANMSHEIRTPLNAIMGFSKELETKQNLVERDEHVRIINAAASDLLTIVNDVLDFSKMEAGKLTLNTKPFSPRELLEDVAALMSKSAHLKQLEFVFDVPDLPNSLLGDAFKIKQLLSNLLSNALKFTNYGHIALKVIVVEEDERNCLIEFQIQDTGIGISETDINKLFTAFHQLDDELNRSFQGTGLGLVICRELTSLMNGKISVTSQSAVGSVFAAKIPFVKDNSAIQLNPIDKFKNQKAFLIDDWALSRQTTLQQLTTTGFKVTCFSHIDALENIDIADQYIFVAMPYKSNENRPEMLEKLSKMNINHLVLLYSGPVPNTLIFSKLNRTPHVIRLPLLTRKVADINQRKVRMKTSSSHNLADSLPAIRMLAVDDMELNLRLLETWLKNSSVTLDVAYNGETAIQLCQQYEYDIILMDIQMPTMDGLEATSYIRKTEMNIGTPIVAVTAHALDSEKQHFLDSGMDDFLSKPIDLTSLTDLVRTWCELPEPTLAQLPDTIDWLLMLQRSNNNKEDAVSFFNNFVASLPNHALEIEAGWQQQRNDVVLASIHKLHGACCYTGVPMLQKLCKDAEQLLKTQQLEQHPKTISTLLLEIEQVVSQWPKLKAGLI